jgi:hypothetical protein
MRSAAFFLALLAGACAATTRSLPAGVHLGKELEPRPVVAFARVDADPGAYFERTLLVEATVTAVCRKAGCWMQIEDEGRTALVRWESGCGGEYVFPTDAVGKRVLVQGSFYPKALSEEDAEHLAAESGGGVAIQREGYEFNASAVLVLDADA